MTRTPAIPRDLEEALNLCDPSVLSEEEARSQLEQWSQDDPEIETHLFKRIFGPDGSAGISAEEPAWGLRFLSIVGGQGSNVRVVSLLYRLLKHPNATIRSKATAMIGKVSPPFNWLEEQAVTETDERVRANGLEALWRPGIPEHLRSLLWSAVENPSNRVVGNALLGLYRQGDSACVPAIAAMIMHPQERFRATAAWVIRETGDDRFRQYLLPLLEDPSDLVKRNAGQALERMQERSDTSDLEPIQLMVISKSRGTVTRRTSLLYGERRHVADPERETVPAHVFRIAAVSEQGDPVSILLATDFCIRRNGSVVEQYTVEKEMLTGGAIAQPENWRNSTYEVRFEVAPDDDLPETEIHILVRRDPLFGEIRISSTANN